MNKGTDIKDNLFYAIHLPITYIDTHTDIYIYTYVTFIYAYMYNILPILISLKVAPVSLFLCCVGKDVPGLWRGGRHLRAGFPSLRCERGELRQGMPGVLELGQRQWKCRLIYQLFTCNYTLSIARQPTVIPDIVMLLKQVERGYLYVMIPKEKSCKQQKVKYFRICSATISHNHV